MYRVIYFKTGPEGVMMSKSIAETRRSALLTPDELHQMMQSEDPPIILAVQSINPYTGQQSRSGQWIPGAIDVEVYTDFASPGSSEQGERPLPAIADLQAAARRWGLSQDRPTVVYDAERAMTAARAWWVLRWAGLRDVRVLDGGLACWIRAGLPTAQCPGTAHESTIELHAGHMPELDAVTAMMLAQQGRLLDARIRPNYIGGLEQGGDPARGHIPGALSAPAPDNFTDEGPLTNSETLAEMYRGLGVTEGMQPGVYCGAGMSAAVTVLALAAIGIEASMYPGSWSQWINDPANPVKRGPFP